MQISNNRKNKFGSDKTKKVWNKTGGHCSYCGRKMKPPISGDGTIKVPSEYLDSMFTFDHLIPKSKGGKISDINNIIGACRKCNNLRGNESLDFLRMKMIFIKNKWPKFNNIQFDFLLEKGIKLHELDKYEFYFEKKGLK